MADVRNPIAQWVIDRIARQYPGAVLQPIAPGEKHETGCTYWCGYWGQTYTCVWEDGHTTIHCTPLDPRRDLKIITGK